MTQLRHNASALTLPAGWEDATQVVAAGANDGGFRPNVVLSQDSSAEKPERFAALQLPSLKRQLAQLQIVKEGAATFGAHAGFLREHTFTTNGKKLGQLQFYVQQRGRVYTLTFTHLASRLAAHRKVAEQLFASLTLE